MSLRRGFNWWLEAVGAFFYPRVCQCCRAEPADAAAGYVGALCRDSVRRCDPPVCSKCGLPYEGSLSEPFECTNCRTLELHFSWARSAARASGVVLEVLHRYKYRRERWFEPFLGELLVSAARAELRLADWDMIVPVPLHPVKERDREFNQAVALARYLGRGVDLPVAERVLRRRQFTSTQTRLGRGGRRENVRGVFEVRAGAQVSGSRVIVVDDVFTTGATTSECARVLKASGASTVGVWTVARGI